VRGRRVKALRRTAVETFGHALPKARYVRLREKPANLFVRFVWWATRYRPRVQVGRYSSAWRRWKKLAKEGSAE